jgi:hypothetical protein
MGSQEIGAPFLFILLLNMTLPLNPKDSRAEIHTLIERLRALPKPLAIARLHELIKLAQEELDKVEKREVNNTTLRT